MNENAENAPLPTFYFFHVIHLTTLQIYHLIIWSLIASTLNLITFYKTLDTLPPSTALTVKLYTYASLRQYYWCIMLYVSVAEAFCLQKPFLFPLIKCCCLRIKFQRAHWETKKILSVLLHLCLNNASFPSKCTVYSQSVCVTQCYKLSWKRQSVKRHQ